MNENDTIYLCHMLDMARKAAEKTHGLERADYDRDENLRLALAHLVQIVGEAARRVSQQTRDACPGIPWREVTGMRHVIVHQYMSLDEDVLWHVVSKDLPSLIAELEKIVQD